MTSSRQERTRDVRDVRVAASGVVFSLQMPLLDMASGVRHSLSTELEVRKLQNLVRKLEEQNEALKMGCSQSTPGGRPNANPKSGGHVAAAAVDDGDGDEENNNIDVKDEDGDVGNDDGLSLDIVELLDLAAPTDAFQDDNWLYESPGRAATAQDQQVDALAWSRQVFDLPRIAAARRAFRYHLDATPGAFLKQRFSLGSLSSSPCLAPITSTLPWTSSTPPPSSAHPNAPGMFHHSSPTTLAPTPSGQPGLALPSPKAKESQLTPPSHRNACQSSLEAAKRRLEMYKESRASSESISFPSRHSGLHKTEGLGREAVRPFSPPSSGESDDSVLESEESRSDSKTETSPAYKLQNVTDVQIMARMQEESLRQDASASASRRSSGSSSVQSLRRSLAASDLDLDRLDDYEENEIDNIGTNPQPTTAPILQHRFTPSPRQSPPPPLSPVTATTALRTPSPPARAMTRGLQQPRKHGMQPLRGRGVHQEASQETCRDSRPDRTCSPGGVDRTYLTSPRASPPLLSSAMPRIRPSLPASRLKRPSPASSILNDGQRQGRSIGLARAPSPNRHRSPNAGSRLSPHQRAATPPESGQDVCGRLSPGLVPIKAVGRQSGLPKLSTHAYTGVPGPARSKLVQPVRRSLQVPKRYSPLRDDGLNDSYY
uniref:SLAIN motif-containing protein 2-like n=1 Tax=Myxine glutinosa TaxID=7769 RepID=UPI00358E39D7